MIRVVSFDLDDTLVSRDFDDKLWFEEVPRLIARERGIPFGEAYKFAVGEYKKYEGTLDWTDINFWFKHFKLESDWNRLIADLKSIIRPFPDTVRAIRKLSKKHKLVIITRGNDNFLEAKLSVDGIGKYFSAAFSTTRDFKKLTKDEEVFKKVAQELCVMPSEIAHVGDDQDGDFDVPKRAGIHAFLLDRTGARRGEHIVKSLDEFVEKVGNL